MSTRKSTGKPSIPSNTSCTNRNANVDLIEHPADGAILCNYNSILMALLRQ